MDNYICTTCGVQYPENEEAPSRCKICNEERQYVNPIGQSWTTLETMQNSNLYKNEIIKKKAVCIALLLNLNLRLDKQHF